MILKKVRDAERKLQRLLSKAHDVIAARRAAKHRTLCYAVVAAALEWWRDPNRPRHQMPALVRACAALEKFETGGVPCLK